MSELVLLKLVENLGWVTFPAMVVMVVAICCIAYSCKRY